jgi:predicted GNAT superfamily acetyltransferase
MEAWQEANDAAAAAGVELRPLTTVEDADRLLDVMIATWGEHQLVPREMIRAFAESGNTSWGAWDGDRVIGYVLGWAGVTPEDGLHTHSHMLAAIPDRRHKGVGFALKLAQKAQCLEQGIRVVRWTFDPLVSRNAHLNLTKLGASADRFLPNEYGEMTDALNRGDRSDRLMVRWELELDRDRMDLPHQDLPEVLGREGDDPDLPAPSDIRSPGGPGAIVKIPREYHELRERDRALADAWREASARAFALCFEAGLVATAFTSDSAYVFTSER